MVKLLALFKRPDDVIGFMNHHDKVYLPLVHKIPGLEKTVINRVRADSFGGVPTYFLITEMHFADKESFRRAMESKENMLAGRELMRFAKGFVTLLVADTGAMMMLNSPAREFVAANYKEKKLIGR